MLQIHIVGNKDTEERLIFDNINYDFVFEKKKEYDFIYISIGSRIVSEGEYHMFPGFLKKKGKTLIVMIDDFSNIKYEDDINRESILKYKDDNENADIFVISYIIKNPNSVVADYPTGDKQIEVINEGVAIYKDLLGQLNDIDPQKYIIANYVRFSKENSYGSAEYKYYTAYKSEINKFLDKLENKLIYKSIYFWAGYNMQYLQNIIYSYEFYKLNPQFEILYSGSLGFGKMQSCYMVFKGWLMQLIKGNPQKIRCSNIKDIYTEFTKDQQSKAISNCFNNFIEFCKNAIDITCEYDDPDVKDFHLMDDSYLPISPANNKQKGGKKQRQSINKSSIKRLSKQVLKQFQTRKRKTKNKTQNTF